MLWEIELFLHKMWPREQWLERQKPKEKQVWDKSQMALVYLFDTKQAWKKWNWVMATELSYNKTYAQRIPESIC